MAGRKQNGPHHLDFFLAPTLLLEEGHLVPAAAKEPRDDCFSSVKSFGDVFP